MQNVLLISCDFKDVHLASNLSIWSRRACTKTWSLSHCTAASASSGVLWMPVDTWYKCLGSSSEVTLVGCCFFIGGAGRCFFAGGDGICKLATLSCGSWRGGFLAGGSFHGKIVGTWLFSSFVPSKCSPQTRVLEVTMKLCSLEILVSHMRRNFASCGNL